MVLFNWVNTAPQKTARSNALLFANPLVFKMISGMTHNFLADKLWLLRATVSEAGAGDSYKVDIEDFIDASTTVAIMDPYFFEANNYAFTYLTSIAADLPSALRLLRMTRFFDNENFKLYFLELIFLVTYAKDHDMHLDYKDIYKMATKISQMPEGRQVLGKFQVKEWVRYIISFAENEILRRAQKLEDLVWLLKHTEDQHKRALIEEKIRELKAVGN